MLDLIARLEAAQGPDRRLDAEIDVATRGGPVSGYPAWVFTNFPIWRARSDFKVEVVHDDGAGGAHWTPRSYTSFLDHALSLVPEGYDYCLSKGHDELPFVSIAPANMVAEFQSSGATPAIALCIAALKARHAVASNEGKTHG